MRITARVLAAAAFVPFLFPLCGRSVTGAVPDLIVTAAPLYRPLAALGGGERFPGGAQLLLVHQGKAQTLVPGFAATADASVSFDGATVLFAGKKAAGDRWQIWELKLADRTLRKVVDSDSDAIRPLYLPSVMTGGRLVYAQRTARGFQLINARATSLSEDAATLDPFPASLQITYLASAIPSDVLADGRILFEAEFPLSAQASDHPLPELLLAYSDGSGVESYRCDHGLARWAGHQLSGGDVVFTHGSTLARFTSPLAHELRIAAPHADYAGAIGETASGEWLISARVAPAAHFSLKLWKPGSASFEPLLADASRDLVEPVVLAPRTRPNRHPSALHPWNYANLLALDVRQSRAGDLKTLPAAVRLETRDASGHAVVNGTAPIYPDGSFFIKVPGDRPIRLSLIDEKGAVIRREHGWFWSRGGEQRICVGCHTGPERASENHVPAVLLHTVIPVDLTGTTPAATPQPKSQGGN